MAARELDGLKDGHARVTMAPSKTAGGKPGGSCAGTARFRAGTWSRSDPACVPPTGDELMALPLPGWALRRRTL